ncbi:MAG: L,D-transpeptidase [Bacteroidia bacterium]|nr:L,D-transpeptidase [Bacteroidia bacterium]
MESNSLYQTWNPSFLSSSPDALDRYHVLIDKSDFVLTLYFDTVRVKSYPIVLGGNPADDKRMEGDGCTPEGIFGIRNKYPHAKWSRFIWVDYPNEDSWRKHNASKEAGEIPEDATIGGEIGIHGVPEGKDHLIDDGTNWTLGCISLKNADVEEIFNLLGPKSTIEIRK